MPKKKLTILLVLLFIALTCTIYKRYPFDHDKITATGTVEVTQVDIAPKVSGYLKDLKIEAGDGVEKDQSIATIVRADLAAQLLRDQAALDKSLAELSDLEKGARAQELTAAAAHLAAAQATYQKTQTDYLRYQALYQSNAISQQQLDQAKETYGLARSNLVSAQAEQNLLAAGTRPDKITAQKLEVKRNQAIVQTSKTAIADTLVKSPLTGTILHKNFENGEYINAGNPIATLADLQDCWVKIYLPSTQLGLIQLGQKAAISIDSFPHKSFAGTIKEINSQAEYTPRQSITKRERVNLVFGVKVQIQNPVGLLKPGMPADVVLQ